MYKRSIYQELIDWSTKSTRKPLILRGARQVGKTTLVTLFANRYEQFLSLNLDLKADCELFERDYAIDDLIAAIHFHLKKPVADSGKTLLFIDEIQNCPKACAMLRYFYEKRNDLHVIAAGSLLETLIDRHISFPVGRVEYLFIYPLSFTEYLLAANENEAFKALKEWPCPDFAHERLLSLFHQYTLVGGMPEAVAAFLKNKDILASNKVYHDLVTAFTDDVEKYGTNKKMVEVIRHAIAHAPIEAGKRIRFHGFGNSHYQSREMGEALRSLEKAMLIQLVYPTTHTAPPVQANYKKSPKLQFLDTGMMNYCANLQQHYFTLEELNTLYTGRVIKNIVGQELLATQSLMQQTLKFWVREKSQSQAEIDYVLPFDCYLIPLEVKSGKTGRLKSLLQYMELTNHTYAVRLYAGKIDVNLLQTASGKSIQLLSLPYYLVSELTTYLKHFVSGDIQAIN